jgi:hypothetical protein
MQTETEDAQKEVVLVEREEVKVEQVLQKVEEKDVVNHVVLINLLEELDLALQAEKKENVKAGKINFSF